MQSSTKVSQAELSDWEIVPCRWWETEYGTVNWSFTHKKYNSRTGFNFTKPRQYHVSLPLYYRPVRRGPALARGSPPAAISATLSGDTTLTYPEELNLDLVGVRMIEDILKPYEVDSGFHHSIMPDLMLEVGKCLDLSTEIDENDVEAGKLLWTELLRDLVGPDISSGAFLERSAEGHRPLSALSSSDYDSEHSTDSDPLPCTPTQKNSFSDVEVHQPSPVTGQNGISPSPSTSLNIAARSFTPSHAVPVKYPSLLASPSPDPISSSSPSPVPLNFTFPSINGNYQYLPPNLRKDDQGFYTAVTPPGSPARPRNDWGRPTSRPTSVRTPSFLSEDGLQRKASKTREIVDQLRCTPVTTRKSNSRGRSKSRLPQNRNDVPSSAPEDSPLADSSESITSGAGKHSDPFQVNYSPNSDGWIELPPRGSELSYTSTHAPSAKHSPVSVPSAPLPNMSPQVVMGPFLSSAAPPAAHFYPQPPVMRAPQFFPVYARPYVAAPPPSPHGAWIPVYPTYPMPLTGTAGMRHASW
ncbi:hypothetical protein BJ138DRAFT_1093799 [Hygrophoropsis aurantiaca]|uniref:Uncharacterized protein n=1 Tax=Hygrophoropsis aurantiaca TaxID=72124 RepID=A0ACB7ZZI9_9AGAM|nr:hypothetical protein BJ138DRAFT_1093799 [Hygrophoropsis aurantiaca]